jgi:hypothetical protein
MDSNPLDREGVANELREVIASLVIADEYGRSLTETTEALACCRAEAWEARLQLGRLVDYLESP